MDSCSTIRVMSLFAVLCLAANNIGAVEQFVPGAVPIREPDNHYPLLYSSVMPVIYKFHLPTWDSVTMKIQFWSKHNNCTESDRYEDGYPCPIMYHMNYLIESFMKNMTSWKNLLFDESHKPSSDFLQDSSLMWKKGLCSNLPIEPHFKGLEASSAELGKYIQLFTQCAERNGTAFNIKLVNMSNVATKLENQYHDTFTSFTSDYWKRLTEATQEATALIAWNTLESTLMAHQYMESQKWIEAVQTCSQQRIPWTIIDKSSLRELLTSLKSGYMEDSHDFAIPIEELSKYFKLPLSDCIFGDDNTFVVRILVPLIPNEAAYKNYFVKFHPLPFVTQGKVCSLWNGEKSAPFNLGFNGIMPCSCNKNDMFCKAWNTVLQDACSTARRLQETCLHALSSDIEQEIIEACPMKCRSVGTRSASEQLGLILESNATNTVRVVPGILNEDQNRATFVKCPGEKIMLPLQTVGAYQLSIPTNCSIETEGSYSSVNKTVTTTLEQVKLLHLLPYHWRNGITVDSTSYEDNASFLDSLEKIEAADPKINLLARKIQQLDRDSEKALGDAFLWLLVLLSLLGNIALGVIVLHLYKWKKEQIYKDNRLVYNITSPDDDMHHFPISGDQQTRPLCDADSL